MMKSSKRKIAALVLAVATSGSLVLGCSGSARRDFRDAALTGASDFVTQTTFEVLNSWFPIPEDAAE